MVWTEVEKKGLAKYHLRIADNSHWEWWIRNMGTVGQKFGKYVRYIFELLHTERHQWNWILN